jgi:hypothetical protein
MVCRNVTDQGKRILMALPTLTPEQRQAALEKAREARKARSELLAALKAGTISMTEVLAREDDVAKKTKVAAAVKALPGYGPAKASAVLAQAGIPDMRRIGGLGEQQRRKLTEALGD